MSSTESKRKKAMERIAYKLEDAKILIEEARALADEHGLHFDVVFSGESIPTGENENWDSSEGSCWSSSSC